MHGMRDVCQQLSGDCTLDGSQGVKFLSIFSFFFSGARLSPFFPFSLFFPHFFSLFRHCVSRQRQKHVTLQNGKHDSRQRFPAVDVHGAFGSDGIRLLRHSSASSSAAAIPATPSVSTAPSIPATSCIRSAPTCIHVCSHRWQRGLWP